MFIFAHKIRLYPTKEQHIYFCKAAGISRLAYNWALAEWDAQYKRGEKPNKNSLRRLFNSIKDKKFPFVREVTKCAPQYGIVNLGKAFDNFFKKRSKYPKFKNRDVKKSFMVSNEALKGTHIKNKSVKIPKLGWVKMAEELRFEGKLLNTVISCESNRWFASFSIQRAEKSHTGENQAVVGVDVGIKTLATCSDGKTYKNPKALSGKLKKLAKLQRTVSRRKKGSNRRERAKRRISNLHWHIGNIRMDAIHKMTTEITKKYSVVVIEDRG